MTHNFFLQNEEILATNCVNKQEISKKKYVSLRLYTIHITYANAASCREVFCIGVITRIGKRHDENTNAVFDPCGMAHVVGVRVGRFLTSKKMLLLG